MNSVVPGEEKRRSARLTALLVAVIFALGTIFIPADIYAAEEVDATVETEAVDSAGEIGTVEPPEEEMPETENPDEITDLLTVTDDQGGEVELEDLDEDEYDGFLYKLKDSVTKKEIGEMENAIDELDGGQAVEEVIGKELYASDSIETIEEVADADMIEYVEPNYRMSAMATNDSYYGEYGWYLDNIAAPYVWDKGMFGEGSTVAVIDSGVTFSHEDFENTHFEAPYNAIDQSQDVTDNSGHGTAVTGIIAASYNNKKGLTGIMPETTIIPIKAMDVNEDNETEGFGDDTIRGLEFAAANGADVVNVSMGTPQGSLALERAFQKAADEGMIVVAACGNRKKSNIYYPAAYDSVISVASVDRYGEVSYFSSYNKKVDVAAYGEDLTVTWKDSKKYVYLSGTSLAAPEVAAMAAMVKSMDKSIDINEFREIIAATSTDKGAKGRDDYYGYGIMDLSKAYRYIARDISLYSASLSGTVYTYSGKVITPSVTVKTLGQRLPSDCYKTYYPSGRKAVGTYKVVLEGVNGYTGKITLSFKIMPHLVKSLKKPLRCKKKLLIRWKAMSKKQKTKYRKSITGYQVRVSKSPKFTKAKYAKVKGMSKTKLLVKGLKRKTTYYVQYRAYKTVGKATYYSKWSKKKKTRTK